MKDLALHIMDIVQNSIEANANLVHIELGEKREEDRLVLMIADNGKGMDQEKLQRVTDPYFTTRTTRKVGLGIPLLKQNAEQSGGSFLISSAPGEGTRITAVFGLSHLDCPPRGDLAGVLSLLAGANPGIDFVFLHSVHSGEYRFDTREVKEVLGEVQISEPSVIGYIKEMIACNLESEMRI